MPLKKKQKSLNFLVVGSATSAKHQLIKKFGDPQAQADSQEARYFPLPIKIWVNREEIECDLYEESDNKHHMSLDLCYLRSCKAVVLTCDTGDLNSIEFILEWLDHYQKTLKESHQFTVRLVITQEHPEQANQLTQNHVAKMVAYGRPSQIQLHEEPIKHTVFQSMAESIITPIQKEKEQVQRAQEAKQIESIQKRKDTLIIELKRYLASFEIKNGKINFSKGLWYARLLPSAVVNREANYQLALNLIERLNNPDCDSHAKIGEAFLNLKEAQLDILKNLRKDYTHRGINSKRLNAVIFMATHFKDDTSQELECHRAL